MSTAWELCEVAGVHIDDLAIDSKEEIEERRRFLLQGAHSALFQYDGSLWEVAEDARTGPIPAYTCLSPEDIERAWEEVELERIYLACSSRATSAPQQYRPDQEAPQYQAGQRSAAPSPAQRAQFQAPFSNSPQQAPFDLQQSGSHVLGCQGETFPEQLNIRGGELSGFQPLVVSQTPACDATFQTPTSYRSRSPPSSTLLEKSTTESTNQKITAKPRVTLTPAPKSTPTKVKAAKESSSITSRVTPLRDTTANATRALTTPTKRTITAINTILSPPTPNIRLRPVPLLSPLSKRHHRKIKFHQPMPQRKSRSSLEASTVRLAIANVCDELRQQNATGSTVTVVQLQNAQQPDSPTRGTTPDPTIPSAIVAARQTDNLQSSAAPAPVKTSFKRRERSRSTSPDRGAYTKRSRRKSYTQSRRGASQIHRDTSPPHRTSHLHSEIPSDDQSHPSNNQALPIRPFDSISAVLDRAQKYVEQET